MSKGSPLDSARIDYEAGVLLHRQGRLAEAEAKYLDVYRTFPHHPGVLHGLGLIRLRTNRPDGAVPVLSEAAQLAPGNKAILADLAVACLAAGQYEQAAAAFAHVLQKWPSDAVARLGLGDALSILGRVDEARAAFKELLASNPALADGYFGLGNLAMQLGDTDAAREQFERAIALAPKQARYHRALAGAGRFAAGDGRLAAMVTLLRESAADDQKIELHFALAKAYDDLARYDDAFGHMKAGNDLQRTRVAYDEASVARTFGDIADVFSIEMMRSRAHAGEPSDLPVFIVGMPRSGSTLVEQILASHPKMHGAGELLLMNDLVAAIPNYPAGVAAAPVTALTALGQRYVERLRILAPGAKRIVDKLPANFRHLGLIRVALPYARIIHIRRDARDTCFSCYSKLFLGGLNFAYDLGELGRYYKMYDALMAHWRAALPATALLDVQYETLVEDLEAQARRIVEFIGMPWDARCLDFSKTERPVRTLSQSQVRQPLFASSIGRWRHYEKHLQPLTDALR